MIAPGALVILSPLLAGMAFGKNCTAGIFCWSDLSKLDPSSIDADTG